MGKERLICLPQRCDDVYASMALDEVLLDETVSTGCNFLKLSTFSEKCITIGLFQKHGGCLNQPLPWTRRISGGGIVEHTDDIIISFSFKSVFSGKLNALYEKIHKAVFNSIKDCFSNMETYGTSNKEKNTRESYCFVSPVKFDIMSNDRKILGGALCRRKNGFLYQGALKSMEYMNVPDFSIPSFEKSLIKAMAGEFNFTPIVDKIDDLILEKTYKLIQSKYNSVEWRTKY